jgi:hypothetical protein
MGVRVAIFRWYLEEETSDSSEQPKSQDGGQVAGENPYNSLQTPAIRDKGINLQY